jgi:glycosyltransferase involved in cell wall biosynthesis
MSSRAGTQSVTTVSRPSPPDVSPHDHARSAVAVDGLPALRILYVIDSLRPGGKERQAVALLQGLASQGHEVQVISMGPDTFFAPDLERAGIRIHYVLRSSKRDMRPWRTLHRITGAMQPDVVHSTCWMTSLFALPTCRMRGVPLVNGSIGNSFANGGVKWKMERWLLRRAHARIANSRAGFRSRGFDPTAPGNHVVYNGFDGTRLAQLDAGVVAGMEALAAGRKLVGMVAQFKSDKDHPTYLEAATRIIRQRDDVVFVTVGDGTNYEALRARHAADAGRIVFLGRRTQVESIASTFYLGVLATFTEGISNAIMEFMALGKPVVATDGGGTCELLADGATGWLVPPRDPAALAEKITYFLDRPGEAAAFGARGRSRIAEVFSYPALIRRTLDVYREVAPVARRTGKRG